MLIETIIYIFTIIDLIVLYKVYKILKNMYTLKQKLIFNNCIIIYNKPDKNYINKLILIIFEYICNGYIFDINDYKNIMNKLENCKLNNCKLNNNSINIIYDTYGGEIQANDIISNYIIESKIKINGYVFNKSQSAGTILALLSDNLYINKNAILSPTDPQITIDDESYSIKSIINMCESKEHNYISDKYLLQYYENKKLHYENIDMITRLINKKLRKHISKEKKKDLIYELTSGDYTHYKPISGLYLNKYIDINLNMPKNITDIYNIFENAYFYL